MAKRVNDLISLIASQDQTGCSPSTLTGFGKGLSFFVCLFVFVRSQINLRCNGLVFFVTLLLNPHFRLKKPVTAKSELKIYWVS